MLIIARLPKVLIYLDWIGRFSCLMLGSNWGTCYCTLGMFGKYLNTALMINKYWEHSPETGLCVEESINCEMSGDRRGMWRYWQSLLLYRCTALYWARTAGCKYLFFLWKLDQQSRWRKECLTFLFVTAVGGVGQLHTELHYSSLLSPSSLASLCRDWFYTSLPTWYVASCCLMLHLEHQTKHPHLGWLLTQICTT